MHASNFRPVKRVGDVVRIFAHVREKLPSKLILIGDGPERLFIQQLVKELKLGDDVHFLGTQDHTEPLFFCADLFLLPSEQESFGLTALEAMACSVPVIGTKIGGLPEVVTHGETGYLFPIGEIKAMADQSVSLLNDSETHGQFRSNARRRATQFFNAEQIIQQYESYYEEILST
jgi:N-acetyl-alpha-D-glucosaminyl L-malate synthase BshA